MSFSDWISDESADGADAERTPGARGFEHAVRLRAQAERESNRARRRYTWRARAELARRTLRRSTDDVDRRKPRS